MPRFLLRINQIFIIIFMLFSCIPIPVANATKAVKPETFSVSANGECNISSEGWIKECDNHLQDVLEKKAQALCEEDSKAIMIKTLKKRTCVPKGQLHMCEIKALFQCE